MGNGVSKSKRKANVLEAVQAGQDFNAICLALQQGSILKCDSSFDYEEIVYLAYLSIVNGVPMEDLFEVCEGDPRVACGQTMYQLFEFLKLPQENFSSWLADRDVFAKVFLLGIEIGVILTKAGFFSPITEQHFQNLFGDTKFMIRDQNKRRIFAESGLPVLIPMYVSTAPRTLD